MKIVHFTDYYQPAVGYQEANLARIHKLMGHEVHVVTSDRFFPFPEYVNTYQEVLGERIRVQGVFEEEGITVHRLPCFFEYPSSAFVLLKGIKKALQTIEPDLLISHGIVGLHPFFSARIKSQLGYKLIYDHHGAVYNTDLYGSLPKRIYLKFWDHIIRPTILKNADKIVAIGHEEREMARELLKIERDVVSIIPLGADTGRFRPDSKLRVQGRRELAVRDDELVIVYAGKLAADKNIDLLVGAFCALSSERKKMRLLLIGNGESGYVASLKQTAEEHQVEDRVIWHDFVPNANLPIYLNAADIGVWTGSPSNVIQEAIATGLPVILRDYPMNRFLVSGNIRCLSETAYKARTDGGALCGILIDCRNIERLDDPLCRLIENQGLRRRMSQQGRKNAMESFSWEAIARAFLSPTADKLASPG